MNGREANQKKDGKTVYGMFQSDYSSTIMNKGK
jgi:hypothetical protein